MSHFNITWQVVPLKLRHVFTISRSSRSEVPNVFLKIEKDGIIGYGEASPNTRYNESPELVTEYFTALQPEIFETATAETWPILLDETERKAGLKRIYSARAAIEMAWFDWQGKAQNQPLWKLWGEKSPKGPVTSYTIGIDSPEVMQQKVRAASQYPIFKIKLGTTRDREIINAIRQVTDKPLRVDANEGWKTLEQAQREIEFLATQNIELIEQPMPAAEFELMKELKRWSPLPLCADESFIGDENLGELSEAFHIINIKLMKIGSLSKARKVVQEAHQLGLEVMIGCMIESSLANAAGALISLNAEYADLDGHLLISNDPFQGLLTDRQARIRLSDKEGLGVWERSPFL